MDRQPLRPTPTPTHTPVRTLSLAVTHPADGQEIPVGVIFTVSGVATGSAAIGEEDPHPIESVTVQLDNGPQTDATLTTPPGLHVPLTVDFSAPKQLTSPGQHHITVRAKDDIGRMVTRSVTVATPGTTYCTPGVPWQNYPQTLSLVPSSTCSPRSLDDVVAVVRQAEAAHRHVHAYGSKWSFSDCAITGDFVVDTSHLNRTLQTVQQALTIADPPPLFHVEAGITIRDLYTRLDGLGLALETMGGASGQSLAGAVSTGTHGGDLFKAPLADSVLALHLVGAGGVQYWIEPSNGITSPSLVQQHVAPGINSANIIYDDGTFDACLVSLGCMGIIYAVVLRVRQQYDLVETTVATTWRDFLRTASAQLNNPFNRFLQVAIDPYTDSNGNNLCLVTTRTEAPPTAPGQRPTGDTQGAVHDMVFSLDLDDLAKIFFNGVLDDKGLSNEQRLVKIVQGILTQTPDQRHVMTEHYGSIMRTLLPTGTFRGKSFSVMDTTFSQPLQASDPAYSIEMFFPAMDINGRLGFADFVGAVIAAINAATDTLLTGYVSLRFTQATRATLGMQQWNQTCAVEISVLQGVNGQLPLLTNILDMSYKYGGRPHWGQLIDLRVHGRGPLYQRYDGWRSVYAKLSNNLTARTFENALSSRWQLTEDGHVWHTERHPTGWSGLGDVNGQFAIPGPVWAVAAASSQPGETQFLFATEDGHLWHTQRRPNGTWSGLGDVNGQFAIPGPVRAVAATSSQPGETQFLFVTADGHLWHTQRRPDGSWSGLGDVNAQFRFPFGLMLLRPVIAVAAASSQPGETQFMFATDDGHLWHTQRLPNGTWSGLGDVNGQFAIPGPVRAVSATSSEPSETQFMFTTEDGHLWHTQRRPTGWSGLGDVNGQFAIPGPVWAVSAASSGPSETQFMFTT